MRAELERLPQPNWFHHGPQILDLLEIYRPMVCVELGSNAGCSAIGIARLIRTWGGALTCVDLWSSFLPTPSTVSFVAFKHNIIGAGVEDVIRAWQMRSAAAAHVYVGQVDFLYVDADHSYAGCTADLEAWWPLMKVGGLIAGDDYDDVSGNPHDGVTRAWDEFEVRHGQSFQRTSTRGAEAVGRLIWGLKA